MQAFSLTPPAAGVPGIALVCDSPHSGTVYPADFGHAIDRAALRQSEDTHVDTLWAQVPAAGGTLLCANFPRSYIDTNRGEADIDVGMIEGAWPHPAQPAPRTLSLGMGLVWRDTPGHAPIYARKLTVQEVALRIERCWRPYREALSQTLERTARQYGACWHLNLHSMPGNVYERLGLAARVPADIVLGDRHGSTCHAAFRDVVAQAFRARGYSVAVNDPYEGAELVRVHGAPARGRHSLQVEINRAVYMDEATREPGAGYAALRRDIGQVLGEVRGFVVNQVAGLRREAPSG